MLKIYCAALCSPNPGGAGVGGFVAVGEKAPFFQETSHVGSGPGMTDMVAEYRNMQRALEWAMLKHPKSKVTICTNSHRIINQLNGTWRVRSPVLLDLIDTIRNTAAKLPAVKYELRNDATQKQIISETKSALARRRRETIEEFRARFKGKKEVSVRDVDIVAVRAHADSITQYLMQQTNPATAFIIAKVLNDFFEKLMGYRIGSVDDVPKICAVAVDLSNRLAAPAQPKSSESGPEFR